jgi:hypothetical protein
MALKIVHRAVWAAIGWRIASSAVPSPTRRACGFSLNVVFAVKQPSDANCRSWRAWVPPTDLTGARTDRLARGRHGGTARAKPPHVEAGRSQRQVARLPSGMETEFGGQAIYLMRIFAAEPSGAGLRFRLLLAHLFLFQMRIDHHPDPVRGVR